MATAYSPEMGPRSSPQSSEPGPQLSLVIDGPAPEEVAEPSQFHRPFEALGQTVREENWQGMNLEQLLRIREQLSTYRGGIAMLMAELAMDDGRALEALIKVNGWIRDRG